MQNMDSGVVANYKVILLGSSTVGKTTIVARLNTGEFRVNTTATVGIDFHSHSVKLDNGTTVNLQIWDTAGQERFRNITRSYYRGAHGVVFVYDVTNPNSFQDLNYWLNSVNETSSKVPVAILLGNKNDLQDSKMVDRSLGEELRDRNATVYRFYEVSAKTGENIEKAFQDLAFYLVDNNPCSPEQLRTSCASLRTSTTNAEGNAAAGHQQRHPQSPNPFARHDSSNVIKLMDKSSAMKQPKEQNCAC